MRTVKIIDIEDLPRRNSAQLKNHWGAVSRDVEALGRVAITNRREIETVVMSAAEYRLLMAKIRETETRQQAVLDQLTARFDDGLSCLQARIPPKGWMTSSRPKAAQR